MLRAIGSADIRIVFHTLAHMQSISRHQHLVSTTDHNFLLTHLLRFLMIRRSRVLLEIVIMIENLAILAGLHGQSWMIGNGLRASRDVLHLNLLDVLLLVHENMRLFGKATHIVILDHFFALMDEVPIVFELLLAQPIVACFLYYVLIYCLLFRLSLEHFVFGRDLHAVGFVVPGLR